MRFYLYSLIFLLLAGFAYGQPTPPGHVADYVTLVWDAGVSSDQTNGGHVKLAVWLAGSPGDFMDLGDGETKAEAWDTNQTGASITEGPGDTINVNAGGIGLITTGTGANVMFEDNGDAATADGNFYVTRVDDNNVTLDGLSYSELAGDQGCDIRIGGAIDGLVSLIANAAGIADAGLYHCTVLMRGNEILPSKVTVGAGGGTVDTRLELIGVNSSWVDDGTQVTLDGGGSITTCLSIEVDYTTLKNVNLTNTTSYPLQVGGAAYFYHYSVINCKADSTAADAVYVSKAGGMFVDCDFRTTHSGSSAVDNLAGSIGFDTCYLETASTTTHCADMDRACNAVNSIFVGGTYGLDTDVYSAAPYAVRNCDFYNQTTSCLNIASNAGTLSVSNNLFWVAAAGADYAITVADAGVLVFEDYNFTNITGNPMYLNGSGAEWQGGNSAKSLWSDTESNLWTDAGNDDFTVVDASMIDGGMPSLSDEGGTPVDGYSTPGAAQLKQTQTGGGGNGGFPATSMLGGLIQE